MATARPIFGYSDSVLEVNETHLNRTFFISSCTTGV